MTKQSTHRIRTTVDDSGFVFTYEYQTRSIAGAVFQTEATETFDTGLLPGCPDWEEPDSVAARCYVYGVRKALEDRSSQVLDPLEKLAFRRELFDFWVESNEWKRERTGGGTRTVPDWIQALADLTGQPVAVIQKQVKSYSPEKVEKLKAGPRVQARIAEIQATRAEAEDTDPLAEFLEE